VEEIGTGTLLLWCVKKGYRVAAIKASSSVPNASERP
jgi:hypothetical protein